MGRKLRYSYKKIGNKINGQRKGKHLHVVVVMIVYLY